MRPLQFLGSLPFLVFLAGTATAQPAISLTVSGNRATGTVALPGGVSADLTITFESVSNLNASALDVSARLIGPSDTSVLSRLPGIVPPGSFPVLLRIDPSAGSALRFRGVATVSLYTYNLVLSTSPPFSLFSASGGAAFHDITTFEGTGSYRVEGSCGGFSEFVVVVDTQSIDSVIAGKFDALQALLDRHGSGILFTLLGNLQGKLDLARALYLAGDLVGAIAQVVAFSDLVKLQSGLLIPDVWRAHDSRVNVAGLLRSAAGTLKFSLNRRLNVSP